MAETRQFFDVWIIESNTVYREVPFTVVTDWVQQGRLLEEDRLRPSGTGDWLLVGSMPAFAAYLPKAEPFRTEDQAEALEQVQLDFAYRSRPMDEDDDVDMIPLIDVSLVLLIFFMMTATVASAGSLIDTPWVITSLVANVPDTLWIGISRAADGQPIYSIGQGDAPAEEGDGKLTTEEELLKRLDNKLAGKRQVEVVVRADQSLPFAVVKKITVALEVRRPHVGRIYNGVRERAQS